MLRGREWVEQRLSREISRGREEMTGVQPLYEILPYEQNRTNESKP